MSKISLTRALAEVKSLDAGIQASISGSMFISISKGSENRPVDNSFSSTDDLVSRITRDLQSVKDKIARRSALKSAIQKANINTTFSFKGRIVSISDAIDMKTDFVFKNILLTQMRHQLSVATRNATQSSDLVDSQVNAAIERLLGADSKNKTAVENNSSLISSTRKAIVDQNQINLVDPLKLGERIREIADELEGARTELDFTLSEINAKTEIEV